MEGDQILDYDPENNHKFTHNKLYSSARFGLSFYLLVNIATTLYLSAQRDGPQGVEGIAFYFGLLLPLLVYFWYIYYNVSQGLMEMKDKKVSSVFRKPFLLLSLVITVAILIGNLLKFLDGELLPLIALVFCILLIKRELDYYEVLSR